ncbi:MFS transporter [Ideonella sp. A 288]|uniref:MFS transporter n=1 Tax=Ideonella sp. A 288 TaxID=1962181 RepID=UPI000B4B9B1A|nr:MFS transporter [Ideonella sp. A 288]
MDVAATAGVPWRHDARIIGLVGLAHGTSHFFHLLLPPLFPWLIQEFGLNFSQLGLLVSVFFVVSGVGQALAGFLVDRVGARPVLLVALALFAAAAAAAALATGYSGLILAAMLAGLGNAPFHPVDFTILNRRVSAARLGHAFSVHGITGNLGWAAASLFMAGIATATGSWRLACVGAAVGALAVLVAMVWHREAIDDRRGKVPEPAQGRPAAGLPDSAATAGEHMLAFLSLPSVWLCFSFFFWTTVALSAVQSFASPALQAMHGLPLSVTSLVVTAYMLCGAAGMVLGGFLVRQAERLERIIAACLLGSAAMLALVGSGWLPGMAAWALTALAGLGVGLAGPSRDMLIKRAAPPGATGRVYGTVYSGLDLGFALAAPVMGRLMDMGLPHAVFLLSATALVAGVGSAGLVGRHVAAARRSGAAKVVA